MPVTNPTAPDPVSISVDPVDLRTVPCTTAAEFTTALADATYGDRIVLTAGNTFTGEFQLRASTAGSTTGTGGDHYVTIISSAYASLPAAGTRVSLSDASNMPTIVASNSGAANKAISCVANTLHHYRFVGIKFTSPAVASYQTVVYIAPTDHTATANFPHHISFERCIMQPHYDYGTLKGFEVDANHAQWVDCYITDCKQTAQGDANAIFGYTGQGPYKVHNCFVEGMGENIFFGSSSNGGVPVTSVFATNFEYLTPADITITNNHIKRRLSYKRDHATYVPCCETAGTGTISSADATTVTFSGSQTLSGKYIKGVTSGSVAKVTSNGTTCNITYFIGSDFTDGESFRYNSGDLSCKNLLEFKAGQRVKIHNNVFENGWVDGQPGNGSLTLTPREYGWLSDFDIQGNKFIDCAGWSFNVADPSQGSGFGTSPYAFSRLLFKNNLLHNPNSTESTSIGAAAVAITLGTNTAGYGGFYSSSANTSISHTTGSSRTVTSAAALFSSYMVGMVIAYGSGRATITAVAGDGLSCTVDINVAFADTSNHAAYLWMVGPSAYVATRYAADSWQIIHNSVVGGSPTYRHALRFQYVESGFEAIYDPIQQATNFVMKDNVFYNGNDPTNSGGGLSGLHEGDAYGLYGTDDVLPLYASTGSVSKNVFFGSQTVQATRSAYLKYSSTDGGAGSTHSTAFHDPDQTGSNNGGSIGFTDYAGGNYALTGTYATWASDGTMAGCNYAALAPTWAAVVAGTPTDSGFRYLPIRWP